jgi:hypothetical protein
MVWPSLVASGLRIGTNILAQRGMMDDSPGFLIPSKGAAMVTTASANPVSFSR